MSKSEKIDKNLKNGQKQPFFNTNWLIKWPFFRFPYSLSSFFAFWSFLVIFGHFWSFLIVLIIFDRFCFFLSQKHQKNQEKNTNLQTFWCCLLWRFLKVNQFVLSQVHSRLRRWVSPHVSRKVVDHLAEHYWNAYTKAMKNACFLSLLSGKITFLILFTT